MLIHEIGLSVVFVLILVVLAISNRIQASRRAHREEEADRARRRAQVADWWRDQLEKRGSP